MKIINVDQEIMGGMPFFDGTRVLIKNLFDSLECGKNIEEFLDGFPSVTREQVTGLLEATYQLVATSALLFDENFALTER
jgi:uncharacterized protein (DUF433 family)